MQTSLNPLVSVVTSGQNLASTLTFGQFVKAIASFLAPYIAMWGAMASIPTFGLGWRILFPIYMVIGIAATFFLAGTPIEEEKNEGKASGFGECFKLLGKPIVLLSFIGIMCHVGIDVGTNTTAPKILMERLGWTLNEAAFATSLYFIFRTIGCFTGTVFLRMMKTRTFFVISVVMMALSMIGMWVGESKMNPDFMFYFIGPNHLNKLTDEEYDKIFPNHNVLNAYCVDYRKIEEHTCEDNKPILEWFNNRNIKPDFMLLFNGIVSGNGNIEKFLKLKDGRYKTQLVCFAHYAAPYVYMMNKLENVPAYVISEDPRYITVNAQDLYHNPKLILSQTNGTSFTIIIITVNMISTPF